MPPEPEQFGRGETRHRLDADDTGKLAMLVPQLGGFSESTGVVVQHRGPQRTVVVTEEHRAVHLSGEADRSDGSEFARHALLQLAERGGHRGAPHLGICSDQSGWG